MPVVDDHPLDRWLAGTMRLSTRSLLLYGLLATSIAAAIGVSRQAVESEVVEVVERHPVSPSGRTAYNADGNTQPRLSSSTRATFEASEANPFAPKNWYAAPSTLPVVVPEEVKPVAPPLPFTYKGRLGGNGEPEFFYLAKGNDSYIVSVGDSFADSYRLEGVRDGVMTITYTPLSVIQKLRYGLEQ